MLKNSPPQAPSYASIADVGAKFGISRATVNRQLAAGSFRAVKMGTKVLVDLASVAAHFAALPPATYGQRRAA